MPGIADAAEQTPFESDPRAYLAKSLPCPDDQQVFLKLLGDVAVFFCFFGWQRPRINGQLPGIGDRSPVDLKAIDIFHTGRLKAAQPTLALPTARHVEPKIAREFSRTTEVDRVLARHCGKWLQLPAEAS